MSGRAEQKPKIGGGFMGGVDPALVVIAFIVAIGFSIFQWFSKNRAERTDREKALKKITDKKKATNPTGGHEKLAEHTGQVLTLYH
jgi:hypothetical protein